MRILFLCTGNTCRSPMAAAYAQHIADGRGISAQCFSAGLSAFEDDTVSPNADAALAEIGLKPLSERPVRFTAALGENSDRIYVMTEQHLGFVKARFPQFAEKTRLLGDGIPDPFGKSLSAYRDCLRAMEPFIEAALS